MATDLNEIEKTALDALKSVQDEARLEAWRVSYLGRSSDLMKVFGGLGALSKEERPAVGQAANRVKQALEDRAGSQIGSCASIGPRALDPEEKLDVTLPGRGMHRGRLHPSTQQLRRVLQILAEMGFQVYTSRASRPTR